MSNSLAPPHVAFLAVFFANQPKKEIEKSFGVCAARPANIKPLANLSEIAVSRDKGGLCFPLLHPFFACSVKCVSRECHKIMTRSRAMAQNAPGRPRLAPSHLNVMKL
jgi:hypothetical protein